VSDDLLDIIGKRHGTDKSSLANDYLFFYHRHLAALRSKSDVRVLEIGVDEGRSLKMWDDYFPHAAVIVGMDVNPRAKRFEGGRFVIELGDQSDSEALLSIGMRHGPFDIILDDGSHIWHHQIKSLVNLFSFVRPGGFYILEGLATSFGGYIPEYNGGTGIASPVSYMMRLATNVTGGGLCDHTNEQDPFLRSAPPLITSIGFHRFTAIIERKL
jgi:hypothetical protein